MLCIFPYDETDDLSLRLWDERPMDWLRRLILIERERDSCLSFMFWVGRPMDWSRRLILREKMKSTSLAKRECWKYGSHGQYFHHVKNVLRNLGHQD